MDIGDNLRIVLIFVVGFGAAAFFAYLDFEREKIREQGYKAGYEQCLGEQDD